MPNVVVIDCSTLLILSHNKYYRPQQGVLSIEMGKNQSKLSKEDKDLLHRETGMDKTDIEVAAL